MKYLNQRGQGATEYIVILAIIVGIAVALLTGPFKTTLQSKVSDITSNISTAK